MTLGTLVLILLSFISGIVIGVLVNVKRKNKGDIDILKVNDELIITIYDPYLSEDYTDEDLIESLKSRLYHGKPNYRKSDVL